MLHPIGRGPTRYDQARGKTIEMRKRFAVHAMGNDGVVIECFCKRNTLHEIGRAGEGCADGAVDHDLDDISLKPGSCEHIFQTRSAPNCVSHGTWSPLHAGNM